MPSSVQAQLADFLTTDGYHTVKAEQDFAKKYQQAWASAPYAPTFVTVDAVVVQSGHVLLVQRKAHPGKGLWALPGGFLDQGEKLIDACIRELREETRLKVPTPVLKGSIKNQQVFDDPYRSARGRTITQAFYIELEPNKELPKVKGSDDAKYARWVPMAELNPMDMFEDHYFIIQEFTGL
jgi:bifunctional NMN adenylyltransferase/nudix hydrolase